MPEFDEFAPRLHPLSEVRAAIERYLARTGPNFPKSLAAVMALGKFHPLHDVGLRQTAAAPAPEEDPVVKQLESDEARMRTAYLAAMDQLGIDVLAFPTATYPPKLNGDRNTTPAGTLSGIASALHWPAAVVPMGYSHESLPSGLQLLGRPWSEPILIELAYAYEQATQHARPAEHRACRTETVAVQEQHDLPNYPLLRPSDRQNALQPQLSLACKPFRCVR